MRDSNMDLCTDFADLFHHTEFQNSSTNSIICVTLVTYTSRKGLDGRDVPATLDP
jgi:hypothetical protein